MVNAMMDIMLLVTVTCYVVLLNSLLVFWTSKCPR
jgi:hypothetical protein